MALTPEQERIRADFVAARGEEAWNEAWDATLRIDPPFVAASLAMQQVPARGRHLSPRFHALCRISVNAAATHLNVPQILPHVRAALDEGATPHEILEVLELASTLGIHTMNIGVPLLVEVLEERGRTGPAPLTERQEELKAEFARVRGYWHDFWNEMLELDPEMFAAYTEFSTVPWRTGPLSPAEKELIYISYDIAATHLYVPGTKLHIRNALNHGATVEQILEVMEISSYLGLDAIETAMPIVARELRERGVDL